MAVTVVIVAVIVVGVLVVVVMVVIVAVLVLAVRTMDVPVVMVELGNMKNASDARRMTSPSGRTQYARGLVAGIRAYLGR